MTKWPVRKKSRNIRSKENSKSSWNKIFSSQLKRETAKKMSTARVQILGNFGSFKMKISEKEINYWDTQEKQVEHEKFDPGCSVVQKSNIKPVLGVKLQVRLITIVQILLMSSINNFSFPNLCFATKKERKRTKKTWNSKTL